MMASKIMNDEKLISILKESPIFTKIFEKSESISLDNWYIAGGAVTQTVWNYLQNKDPLYGIKDIDLVFYSKDSSLENDKILQEKINIEFKDLGYHFDVQNEANVHLWYEEKFGDKIAQCKSTEDGISTWLSAFSVGVRKEKEDFIVYSTSGLDDLFSMTVRPNKRQITEPIFNKMVSRLLKNWPEIEVIPWSN